MHFLKQLWRVLIQANYQSVFFVVAGAAVIACLPMALVQRTQFLQGAGPMEGWIWVLIGAGTICLLSSARLPRLERSKAYCRLLVPCGLLIPFASLAMGVGLAMATAVGILAWIPQKNVQNLATRLLSLNVALLVGFFALTIFQYCDARITDYAFLATPLAWVYWLLGYEAVAEGSLVILAIESRTTTILASPDKFGAAYFILFLSSFWTLGLMSRLPIKLMTIATLFAVVYSLLRTVAFLSGIMSGTLATDWWNETTIFISYLPLSVILVGFLCHQLPAGEAQQLEEQTEGSPRPLFAVVLTALATLMVTFAWNFAAPGIEKTGKVVIDERYSRWEWSEAPINTQAYGVKTVYSYYNMMEELGRYYEIDRNFDSISDDKLKDVSVLILKTPTEMYPPEDREAIWRFVENGGGLWLIGDHTNIFGMNSNLNSVGSKYGIKFGADSVIDPDANRQLFRPAKTAHPIVRRLPTFLWYTGDSLQVPWGINDVILSDRLLIDSPDYSVNTFFGDFLPNLDEKVGPVAQATAIEVGKGRVAAWSDSTLFSNFSIFMPGKMELAMGYVDWLNRSNQFSWLRPTLLIVGVSFLALGLFVYRSSLSVVVVGCWLGIGLMSLAITTSNDFFYPVKKANVLATGVSYYEPDSGSFHYPLLNTFNDPTSTGYLTSFISSQRVGKRPALARQMEDAIKNPAVVWASPKDELDESSQRKLLNYVESGGRLILLDAGAGKEPAVGQLLTLFGIQIEPYRVDYKQINEENQRIVNDPDVPTWAKKAIEKSSNDPTQGWPYLSLEGQSIGKSEVAFSIQSGRPLVTAGTASVVSTVSVGEGTVIICGTKTLFSDKSMGANSAVPDGRQLRILNLVYDWLDPGRNAPDIVKTR